VPGVGPRFAELLRRAGIPDAQALADADPDVVATVVGPERAKSLIVAARELLGR
jgi:predicted RecB family nuclease